MPGGGGGTQTTSSEVPKQYKDFANQNLSIAGTMANSPYVGYQGPTVAGFSDMETGAFNSMQDNMNAWGPAMRQSAEAIGGLATGSGDVTVRNGSEYLSNYQNPHENTVVNNTINDMTRANTIAQNGLNATAAGAGAFGGSRHGIANAEMNRNLLDRVGNTAGQLRHQGFTTAAGLGQADASRQLQGDTFNTNTRLQAAQMAQNLGLGAQRAGLQAGGMQRGMDQANLDESYNRFLDEQEHPMRMLAMRQSALGQTPMGSIQRSPKPGMDVGGLLGGAGTFAMGAAKLAPFLCWVAREVYGEDDPRWLEYRDKMLAHGSDELVSAYAEHGPAFAEHIRHNPAMKAQVREAMDMVLAA